MLSVFKPIKPVSLLPHQDEAVSWMTFMESSSGYRGGILADNMGLGKTFSIMGLILADIKRGVELPNLIIVPKAMVDTWVDTYKDYNFSVYSICSKKREWVQKSVGSSFVYITHYHAVLGKPWLFSRFWHRIIIDEAHNIRNFKGALYRAISVLVSFYKWYVTATPVINSIKDIVAPMEWLGIRCSKMSRVELEEIYNDIFSKVLLRRTANDIPALAELMPKEKWCSSVVSMNSYESAVFAYICRACSFSQNMLKVLLGDSKNISIQELRNELLHLESSEDSDEEEDDSENDRVYEDISPLKGLHYLKLLAIDYRLLPPELIKKAREMSNLPDIMGSKGVPSKFRKVREILRGSEGSNIIFCQINKEIENLKDYLVSSGDFAREDIYIINGSVGEEERRGVLEIMKRRVSRGERIVLLLQLKSGACGLNLQFFSGVIFMVLWWNQAIISQAVGRVVRLGASGIKYVYNVSFGVGYDSLVSRVLINKHY